MMLAVRVGAEGGIHNYALPLSYLLVQFCATVHVSSCSWDGAETRRGIPVPLQGYTGATGQQGATFKNT